MEQKANAGAGTAARADCGPGSPFARTGCAIDWLPSTRAHPRNPIESMPQAAASEGPSDQRSREAQARATTIRLLQVLAAAALLLPVLLFAFASALSYRATYALADERIERSLDVLQEQAL